jgi:hypothetical protein
MRDPGIGTKSAWRPLQWIGRLYAEGGRTDGNYSRNLAPNEAYDPATNPWEQRAPMPTARSGIAAQVLEGRIFVFGGEAPAGTYQAEAYEPEATAGPAIRVCRTARHGLGATVVAGRIYVVSGGSTPGDSVSVVNVRAVSQIEPQDRCFAPST